MHPLILLGPGTLCCDHGCHGVTSIPLEVSQQVSDQAQLYIGGQLPQNLSQTPPQILQYHDNFQTKANTTKTKTATAKTKTKTSTLKNKTKDNNTAHFFCICELQSSLHHSHKFDIIIM